LLAKPGALAADAEARDDLAYRLMSFLARYFQQPAAAADQQQQPTAAVMVVLVHLQVLGQVVDTPG